MSNAKSRPEAGFSLVETVAAMGVLAIAALPLMQIAGDAANNTGRLETRLLARIVAENELSYVISDRDPRDVGLTSGFSRQLERTFEWTLVAGPANPGEVQSFEITVRRDDDPQVLARLVSLKAIPLPVREPAEEVAETAPSDNEDNTQTPEEEIEE